PAPSGACVVAIDVRARDAPQGGGHESVAGPRCTWPDGCALPPTPERCLSVWCPCTSSKRRKNAPTSSNDHADKSVDFIGISWSILETLRVVRDSKSREGNLVSVRFRPPAP